MWSIYDHIWDTLTTIYEGTFWLRRHYDCHTKFEYTEMKKNKKNEREDFIVSVQDLICFFRLFFFVPCNLISPSSYSFSFQCIRILCHGLKVDSLAPTVP